MSKNTFKRYAALLLIGEEGKKALCSHQRFLMHLCIITHYIMEENISVVIVYKLSVQKEH